MKDLSAAGRTILSNIIYFDGYFQSSKTGESEVENIENSIDSSILFLNRVRVFLAERFFANLGIISNSNNPFRCIQRTGIMYKRDRPVCVKEDTSIKNVRMYNDRGKSDEREADSRNVMH